MVATPFCTSPRKQPSKEQGNNMYSNPNRLQTPPVVATTRKMRFLIAIDKSDPAKWALELGAKMAQEVSGTLVLLTVVPTNGVAGIVEGMFELMDPHHHHEGEELLEKLR